MWVIFIFVGITSTNPLNPNFAAINRGDLALNVAVYRWAFKDRNQDKNQDRNDDRDATVI